MPEPQEDSAVLNLDSGVTLMGIYQALMAYAETIPDMGVARVTFEQGPSRTEWTATAKLKCLGDLKTEVSDLSADEVAVLTGLEPQVVHEQMWTARGPGLAGAVEELRDTVENFLKTLRQRRERDIRTADTALRVLANPEELRTVWAVRDNPIDEAEAPPNES